MVFIGTKRGGFPPHVSIALENEHQTNHQCLVHPTCEGKWAEISSSSSVLPGPAVANCPLPDSCCAVWCNVWVQTPDGLG